MNSAIPVTAFVLLATTMAASAQISTSSAAGSFPSDVMSGAGAMVTGFDVRVTADSGWRIGAKADPFAAHDGCTNVPR